MNTKNQVAHLAERLMVLGFPAHLERELHLHCWLQPPVFTLSCQQEREGDQLWARIFFQRREEDGGYEGRYFDAVLKKRIEVPAAVVEEVDLRALDTTMARIHWKDLFAVVAPTNLQDAGTMELVETIAGQLRRLETTSLGRRAADLLTARHWQDTPLEPYCRSLAAIKSAHQVLQRFYLFEGEPFITLEEAGRFLQYRWRERRLQARVKDKEGAEGHPTEAEVNDQKSSAKEARRKG